MISDNRYTFRILVHRIPIEAPVRTSFGTMHDRPSLLIGVEDHDGYVGWGEVWCNYPAVGAEHRARLLQSCILPAATEIGNFENPEHLLSQLSARLRVLAIQTGEHGPINQCLAGLDCALHDLAARRQDLPLCAYLSADAASHVQIYASGINPDRPVDMVRSAMDAGHTAFKLKVGFGKSVDTNNLAEIRGALGGSHRFMADANQAWSLQDALALEGPLNDAELSWLEEPLRHDHSSSDWRHLADTLSAPLAAGENFSDAEDFEILPDARKLRVIQPDLGKWGGISRSMHIARRVHANGLMYCPHWLGGGVGLLASLHVKAAVGGPGMAEVDVNPNPMRTQIANTVMSSLDQGIVQLEQSAGIGGVSERLESFADCLVLDLVYVDSG